MTTPPVHLEIERKYLLSQRPDLPPDHRVCQIEQGYLPDRRGRLRRTVEGERVTCYHTIKRGDGLVREEQEREIDERELLALWPGTAGRRLAKTRFLVADGELVWVVDEFDAIELVLAEVELPSVDTPSPPPPWLAPTIVREVTNEPAFRNAVLADRISSEPG